jgi:hypothetical protein
MSEAELHVLRARLQGGIEAKLGAENCLFGQRWALSHADSQLVIDPDLQFNNPCSVV